MHTLKNDVSGLLTTDTTAVLLHIFVNILVSNSSLGIAYSKLIHTKTAIRITIIGKANIKTIIYHKLLQSLNMSRTGIIIDIETIWLSIDHIALGTERLKMDLAIFQELPLAQSRPTFIPLKEYTPSEMR